MLIIGFTVVYILLSSKQDQSIQEVTVNEKILSSQNFSLDAASSGLNTSAKGTVFVKETSKKLQTIQIVALIEIDPKDWGGVAFYVPKDWMIAKIESSYTENQTAISPDNYASTWTNSDKNAYWHSWIEFGRDRRYETGQGGTGIVKIELVSNKKLNTFELTVEAGSAVHGNVKKMGTDTIRVPIPLT
ncbi:hypothetical protein [Paenibacillus sp. JDR-2]|uniref:hypothetical protein n=1 Tax=Paenibacillus sp. (strain JDR-2) TaxID=324057 RepID=UPI0005A1188A|nr:hypothetical protein [Paenibacillus sp. JDR-2]